MLAGRGSFLLTCPEYNQTLPNIFQGCEDVKQGSQHLPFLSAKPKGKRKRNSYPWGHLYG